MKRLSRRTSIIAAILATYLAGLGWGYVRLPWAAMKSLSDAGAVLDPPVTLDLDRAEISPAQERYLKQHLHESPTPALPRVNVSVTWNAFVCARVQCGYYFSPIGAEGKDTLFICLFGTWIPVHTYSDEMA